MSRNEEYSQRTRLAAVALEAATKAEKDMKRIYGVLVIMGMLVGAGVAFSNCKNGLAKKDELTALAQQQETTSKIVVDHAARLTSVEKQADHMEIKMDWMIAQFQRLGERWRVELDPPPPPKARTP